MLTQLGSIRELDDEELARLYDYPERDGTWVRANFIASIDGGATADGKTGTIALKRVTVKSYERNDVLVSGGVAEGSNVVALGVQKLNPAEKVKVVSSLSF